jgi:hypothetical protein
MASLRDYLWEPPQVSEWHDALTSAEKLELSRTLTHGMRQADKMAAVMCGHERDITPWTATASEAFDLICDMI